LVLVAVDEAKETGPTAVDQPADDESSSASHGAAEVSPVTSSKLFLSISSSSMTTTQDVTRSVSTAASDEDRESGMEIEEIMV